jgi:hypothetical protein
LDLDSNHATKLLLKLRPKPSPRQHASLNTFKFSNYINASFFENMKLYFGSKLLVLTVVQNTKLKKSLSWAF